MRDCEIRSGQYIPDDLCINIYNSRSTENRIGSSEASWDIVPSAILIAKILNSEGISKVDGLVAGLLMGG